jgi:hypothetical protein
MKENEEESYNDFGVIILIALVILVMSAISKEEARLTCNSDSLDVFEKKELRTSLRQLNDESRLSRKLQGNLDSINRSLNIDTNDYTFTNSNATETYLKAYEAFTKDIRALKFKVMCIKVVKNKINITKKYNFALKKIIESRQLVKYQKDAMNNLRKIKKFIEFSNFFGGTFLAQYKHDEIIELQFKLSEVINSYLKGGGNDIDSLKNIAIMDIEKMSMSEMQQLIDSGIRNKFYIILSSKKD